MEKKCEGHCPRCGTQKIDYGDSEICDGFIYYRATCEKCGCVFKEYNDIVYSSTEYDDEEIDFDNIYNLLLDNYLEQIKDNINVKRNRERLKKAKEVTEKISKEISKLIENRNLTVLRKVVNNIAKLEKHRFGIGDTDTDEAIVGAFEKRCKEKYGESEELKDFVDEFYQKLHWE